MNKNIQIIVYAKEKILSGYLQIHYFFSNADLKNQYIHKTLLLLIFSIKKPIEL